MRLPEGYVINGVRPVRHLYYFLGGMYPDFSIFVNPFNASLTVQDKYLNTVQRRYIKDAEKLFGVLQVRFKISRQDILVWSDSKVIETVQACVVKHNMIMSFFHSGEFCNEETSGNPIHPNEVVHEFYYNAMRTENELAEEIQQQ